MPVNLVTLAHFAVSAAMYLPKSPDVIGIGTPPRSAIRAFNLGSASPALISLLIVATMSGAARLQELRSELLLLEVLLLGRRMSTRRTRRRAPTAPDQRSPHQPLMAGRAMGTAQDPTRTR